MDTIKVLYKKPGVEPETKLIESSADEIRSLVGGPFEASHIYVGRKQFAFYCHQEGKLEGLAPNFLNVVFGPNFLNVGSLDIWDIVVGPVVFFRIDGEDEASLSESDIDILKTWLSMFAI